LASNQPVRSFARLLQFVGLTIPPLSMFWQLTGAITLGQMLTMLVGAVCCFGIGWILGGYAQK
jgi:hypothetical protein